MRSPMIALIAVRRASCSAADALLRKAAATFWVAVLGLVVMGGGPSGAEAAVLAAPVAVGLVSMARRRIGCLGREGGGKLVQRSGLNSTLLGSRGWCAVGACAVVSVVGVGRGVPVPVGDPLVGGDVLCRIRVGGGFLHLSADSGGATR